MALSGRIRAAVRRPPVEGTSFLTAAENEAISTMFSRIGEGRSDPAGKGANCTVAGGRVRDAARIAWYRQHLAELSRAIADGAKVRAYHAWTLLDNFEWESGYSQRMGLTYVDFQTLKRTIKDSGYWYGRVAASGRLSV